ncbi:hypothetical protein AL755_11520 [Arthrobacter sp. ERGS1:01]|uniref:DUF4097 family beta strand repeat-containing protein n=1 Tax=Arthrobacter sp. ERGS1:01 TaxID=1704044 RepID=UPI0006B55C73|nr:DUF4097 family beta strand repeat-containing protein [Arthrobacter sp. ERGS1:01]ALE05950.1 hypothetical protein AL755_11520 [Arthrobacter sp. ERGS1:01]
MTTKPRTLLALGGIVLLALVATGCGSESGTANATVETKSFSFSGENLIVTSHSSDLELISADVDEIQVERASSGSMIGAEPKSVWQLDGNTLTLDQSCTGISINCGARFTVKVPRNVTLSAENGGGRIKATGFTTELSLMTMDGDIDAEKISAKSVTASSRNGKVQLELGAVPDLVNVQSQDGIIQLALPQATYAVDTSAKKGRISVNVATDDGSAHVVKAHSRNGDISVEKAP